MLATGHADMGTPPGAGASRAPRRRRSPTGRLWTYLCDDRPFVGADLLRRSVRNRGRRAASGAAEPRRDALARRTFRAHFRSAQDSIVVGFVGSISRLASVRPSCSNVLYPARATRNKIKGLCESASWVGLLAPQPDPSKPLQSRDIVPRWG